MYSGLGAPSRTQQGLSSRARTTCDSVCSSCAGCLERLTCNASPVIAMFLPAAMTTPGFCAMRERSRTRRASESPPGRVRGATNETHSGVRIGLVVQFAADEPSRCHRPFRDARAPTSSACCWPCDSCCASSPHIHAGQESGSAPTRYHLDLRHVDNRRASREARGGYEYSRSLNPTRTAPRGVQALLRAAARPGVRVSGLAAEDTLLRTISAPGSHFVVPDDACGATSIGRLRECISAVAADPGI